MPFGEFMYTVNHNFYSMYHNGLNSATVVTAGLFTFVCLFFSYGNITFDLRLFYLRLLFQEHN